MIFKNKGFYTLFLFSVIVLSIGKTETSMGQDKNVLEVISLQALPNDFVDKQDRSNYDANGNLGVGVKIQSNLSGLNFQSPIGIIKTEKEFENEWLILLSENEREITVYAEGYFPYTIIFNSYDIKLESGQFYLLKIQGVNNEADNKLTNQTPSTLPNIVEPKKSVQPKFKTIPNRSKTQSYLEFGLLSRIPKNEVFIRNFNPSIGLDVQYYWVKNIRNWVHFYLNAGYNYSQYGLKNTNLLQEGKQFYHSELNSGLGIRIKMNSTTSLNLGLGGTLSQLIIRDDIFGGNETEAQKEKQYLHLINYDVGLEFRKWHFYLKPSFVSYPENLNQITTGVRFKLISGS